MSISDNSHNIAQCRWNTILAPLVVLSLAASLSSSAKQPEEKDSTPPRYEASWESLRTKRAPEWFEDAKFGVFIHWGAYSVLGYIKGGSGYAEHTPKAICSDPKHYYPFMKRTFGAQPPEFGYKDVIPLFKAEKWNPDGWADLFREAGARYVVLTAEHHDGYALWDSDLTDWCATKVGPKRDLVGDLGVAVRKQGMKYAPSFHRERHPGFFAQQLHDIASSPRPDIAEEIRRVPAAAGLYGPFTYSDAFIEDYVARWKEIERKYQPDFMWIDGVPIFQQRWSKDYNHPQSIKFREACMHMIADYFNTAEVWGKAVYVNNKGPEGAHNWPVGVGCREKDNLIMPSTAPKWQNPATLGTSYGYLKAEEEKDAYKSPTQLIHLLCDVVSKNGNLLLNIGPKADGTIPAGMTSRLLAMGRWLKINGEAIYGTRPWVTSEQKGPDLNLRFTTKGDVIYALVLKRPAAPFLIQSPKGQPVRSVSRIGLLGSDEDIQWKQEQNGLRIVPPAQWPGDHAWVFKIETQPPPE